MTYVAATTRRLNDEIVTKSSTRLWKYDHSLTIETDLKIYALLCETQKSRMLLLQTNYSDQSKTRRVLYSLDLLCEHVTQSHLSTQRNNLSGTQKQRWPLAVTISNNECNNHRDIKPKSCHNQSTKMGWEDGFANQLEEFQMSQQHFMHLHDPTPKQWNIKL